MTVSLVGATSAARTRPYITTDMFKLHTRAGVQVESLAPKGDPADQEAALAEFIFQASGWMDDQAEQILYATVDTWAGLTNVDRQGYAEVFPRFKPVIGLTAFSIGPAPDQLTAQTSFIGAMVTESGFMVPTFPGLGVWSSQGPIQFGGIGAPCDQAFCQYSYVHGFPLTYLTGSLTAGATSIPVADTTGIVAGQTWLNVRAGRTRFQFLATSISTADAGGLGSGPGTIGCAAVPADVVNPDVPIQVDGLPGGLITACVLATRAHIKGKTPSTPARGKERKTTPGDDFQEAWSLVRKYAQVAQ